MNEAGRMIVSDSTIDGNTTLVSGGGGIYNRDLLAVANSVISQNSTISGGMQGGGIMNRGSRLFVEETTFLNNASTGAGSGLMNYTLATINNSTFTGNSTPSTLGGGGIGNFGNLTLTNSTFSDNSVSGSGGAVYNQSYPTMAKSTFSNNTFSNNTAANAGGAVYNGYNSYYSLDTNLTLTDNTFLNNIATSQGGAVYNTSNLTITNSAFSGNAGVINGGGAILNTSNLTMTNSTFSDNSTTANGGAIFNTIPGILGVNQSTFSGNSATEGGVIYNIAGTITVENSIFADSPSGGNCYTLAGTLAVDSYNLSTDGTCNSATQTTSEAINLGALADNGGSTPTMKLPWDSVAIDAADPGACAATDQRGVLRPQGAGCDVGAYELGLYTLTVVPNVPDYGVVTSDPVGIDCGSDCSEIYHEGTVVTLTRTLASHVGSLLWEGACSGTADCVVTVDADKVVTATFLLEQHELSVALAGNGSGSVTSNPAGIDCGTDCSENFDYGTVITLTAVADTGSTFTGWAGVCTGAAECVVTADSAQTVTATYELVPYELSVTLAGNGSGSVTSNPPGIDCGTDCAASFDYGTTVTLTAVTEEGSMFTGWEGDCTGASECVVTVDAAKSITATFTIIEYQMFMPYNWISISNDTN